jgi:orotidine-5'-phosphate decarboxylase
MHANSKFPTRAVPASASSPSSAPTSAIERLVLALDVPSTEQAAEVVEALRGRVGQFKIGLELFTSCGPQFVGSLAAQGEKIFLDLKFHDIPNTVRAASRAAAALGVAMFNVHAGGGIKMMEAALEGAREGSGNSAMPRVLGVTVLTSLAAADLAVLGITETPDQLVVRLARLAQQAGLHGVVASAREAAEIREACGAGFLIVTPGIRPAASQAQDQARIATPAAAIRAGADFLVMGRPITQVPDRAGAAAAAVKEIEAAMKSVRD